MEPSPIETEGKARLSQSATFSPAAGLILDLGPQHCKASVNLDMPVLSTHLHQNMRQIIQSKQVAKQKHRLAVTTLLWLDEILHHFDTMGNLSHRLLIFYKGIITPGVLNGGFQNGCRHHPQESRIGRAGPVSHSRRVWAPCTALAWGSQYVALLHIDLPRIFSR